MVQLDEERTVLKRKTNPETSASSPVKRNYGGVPQVYFDSVIVVA